MTWGGGGGYGRDGWNRLTVLYCPVLGWERNGIRIHTPPSLPARSVRGDIFSTLRSGNKGKYRHIPYQLLPFHTRLSRYHTRPYQTIIPTSNLHSHPLARRFQLNALSSLSAIYHPPPFSHHRPYSHTSPPLLQLLIQTQRTNPSATSHPHRQKTSAHHPQKNQETLRHRDPFDSHHRTPTTATPAPFVCSCPPPRTTATHASETPWSSIKTRATTTASTKQPAVS